MSTGDPMADRAGQASVRLVAGDVAPRYDDARGLLLQEVVITEQGTQAHLPIVDVKMRDADGKLHVLTLTGRIVLGIAAAIRGVNQRNHGKPEP